MHMSFFSFAVSFLSVGLLTSLRSFFHTAVGIVKPIALSSPTGTTSKWSKQPLGPAQALARQSERGPLAIRHRSPPCESPSGCHGQRRSWIPSLSRAKRDPSTMNRRRKPHHRKVSLSPKRCIALFLKTCCIHLCREWIARNAITVSRSSLGDGG